MYGDTFSTPHTPHRPWGPCGVSGHKMCPHTWLTYQVTAGCLKPGFHVVVSVVSFVRKKFIGQIQLYGNLPCKCSIQKKRQIQLVVRDRMNSICPMKFFRTRDTTDTTIWKPGFRALAASTATRATLQISIFFSISLLSHIVHDVGLALLSKP